jgi:hypothetical protein
MKLRKQRVEHGPGDQQLQGAEREMERAGADAELCGLNAKSASNCLAIMAVTVRKAWLRANALASAMSIAQLLRESGCCSCMGAYGATWADHSHRRVCLLENN